MLKTSQQTIGRWEAGKAEPNLAALRDLALIFGTSVDDLMGMGSSQRKIPTTTYHLLAKGEQDGFWGHIGLRIGERPSMWFPVTASTVTSVGQALVNVEGPQTWIGFETLANKFVAFRPTALRKVWLLDDACDQPDGDWEVELPYQGLPLEMYRAFDQLSDTPIAEETWVEAAAVLPRKNEAGEVVGDLEAWRAFLKDLGDVFGGEASEIFLSNVAETFILERLYEDERYYAYLHHTKVCFVDGTSETFWVEGEDLADFAFAVEIDDLPKMLRLEHFGGSAEPYYSTDQIAVVVMPLIDLLDAQKEEAVEA
jgi:hypothetical protein